jgi:hypothetical protein
MSFMGPMGDEEIRVESVGPRLFGGRYGVKIVERGRSDTIA